MLYNTQQLCFLSACRKYIELFFDWIKIFIYGICCYVYLWFITAVTSPDGETTPVATSKKIIMKGNKSSIAAKLRWQKVRAERLLKEKDSIK